MDPLQDQIEMRKLMVSVADALDRIVDACSRQRQPAPPAEPPAKPQTVTRR